MGQESFNPVNYCWTWTADWYEWDSQEGHRLAKQARNARMKELKGRGFRTKGWSNTNSLISRGGAGSGHPHIELFCTVYHVNY